MVEVKGGKRIDGKGKIVGDKNIEDGEKLIGKKKNKMKFKNKLELERGSIVKVKIGKEKKEKGLFNVLGDMKLNGKLKIKEMGDLGKGIYSIFDFGGKRYGNMKLGQVNKGKDK